MTLRARLIALAVALAVLFSFGIVLLLRSRTPDCGVAAPRPSLAPALRALGDFDQAYDVANPAALEEAALHAATVLHAGLIGTTPETPVPVASATATSPDAVVVPLRANPSSSPGPPPLAGLVVFLRDCQGNAYFAQVDDLTTLQPPDTAFPAIGRDQAVVRLGSASIRLEYTTSPLHPMWVITSGASRSLDAG